RGWRPDRSTPPGTGAGGHAAPPGPWCRFTEVSGKDGDSPRSRITIDFARHGEEAMSLAIPTLARRPRPHRRRKPVCPPPPCGGVHRFGLRFEWLEDRTVLSTFTVTNTDNSGPGSLRQAILDSNAATGVGNTIDFAIPGPGVQVIAPLSPLPAIT